MNAPVPSDRFNLPLAQLREVEPRLFIADASRLLGVDESAAGARLAPALGLRWLERDLALSLKVRADLAPSSEWRRRSCCIAEHDGSLIGLLTQPLNAATRTFVQSVALPQPVSLALVSHETLDALLGSIDPHPSSSAVMDSALPVDEEDRAELLVSGDIDGPVTAVAVVDQCLAAALKVEASDIHIESTGSGLLVRLRVDGLLEPLQRVPGRELAEQVLSRLKVLGSLDISERRRPQDGRLRVRFADRAIDVRLSVMPSVHGEDAVLRLLDKSALVGSDERLTLEALGFEEAGLARLRRLATLPYGMLLVTGPTGSGKTTTLYAILSEIDRGRDKIVTIEDPVEYQLPDILQVPVNEKKGLTFAVGLRSILRHDPDRIMVGEIRDRETADIAVQAALTGHLVLTTVHANNVFDVIGRFAHMGIDPYTFVSALNGIWAQRLLRRVCPACAEPSAEIDESLRMGRRGNWVTARGCALCRGTGFKGRLAVAELLVMDDEMRRRILERAPPASLREAARLRGTVLLRDAAMEAAARGLTTVDEVLRVTREDC